jgi:nucleotide-binding universal stress UspA family protein
MGMYKKIAIATDGSEHSKRAAENAIHIAKYSSGSKILKWLSLEVEGLMYFKNLYGEV